MKQGQISISNKDKLSLVSNLSTMLTAGIPILETIDALLEDSKGNMKKILETLREGIVQGQHLYKSFSLFPLIFDKVTISVLKASEEAGTLDVTLKDLKEQIKKDIEFNDKIKGALTYPIIISIVFFLVFIIILVVVIPKISTVFLSLNVTLPLPTRIMIFLSDSIISYPIPFFLGVFLFVLGLYFFVKKEKRFILHIIFFLPLVRILVRDIDLTRFSRSMYLLLSSGITITGALELTEGVVRIPEVEAVIVNAKEMVSAGHRLSESFKQHRKIFSGITIKIIEAGERTGTLDQSMQDISENLDYQVSNTLKTLTTLLEPLMLMVIGLLVGGMMMAILGPIYGLIGQVR